MGIRCQHGSTRFTQVGLPFPVLQGSPRWFLTCQKPPERPPVHPGPLGIIPVHHGGTTVQPPVLPGSPRSMDRGEPGSTGSPVGLGHNCRFLRFFVRSVPLFRSLMLTPMRFIDFKVGQDTDQGREPVSWARSSPVPGVVAYFRHGYAAGQQ